MPLAPAFIGPSYTSLSPVAAGERTINFYLEKIDTAGAAFPWVLYPTPGMTLVGAFALGPARALFAQNDRLFAIVGTTLLEIFENYAVSARGAVATDAENSPARITGNGDGGNQLAIASAGLYYYYDLSTNTLTAPGTPTAHQVGMLDGFIWALDRDSSTLHASPALDATSFPGFQLRDMAPDPWRSAVTMRRQIVLCGDRSSEIWYNAGTSPFPFAPIPNGGFAVGIAANESLVSIGDWAMWLAKTQDGEGDVVLLRGTVPEVVSTHGVRTAIQSYSRIDDAIADAYEELGHTFYVLSFPTANATWVYDLTSQTWTERGSWVAATATYSAWRPTWHAYLWGRHLWLDREQGSLYQASLTVNTDVNGAAIRRVRRGPLFWKDHARIFFSSFTLVTEAGLGISGTVPTVGVDPQIELNYSNDGGKTWGTFGFRSAGRIGEYSAESTWQRCGSSKRRVFEVVMSDPIPWRVLGAIIDAKVGTGR
jgi:hypothetical protein